MVKKTNIYNKERVKELQLYTENTGKIYEKTSKPIFDNLSKKLKKGIYDKDKAQKSYLKISTEGAKSYEKEFGSQGSKIFSLADRKEVAKRMEQENKSELKNNY